MPPRYAAGLTPTSEAVGRRRAVAVADHDVGVTVEPVADAAHRADDVLVAAELGAQAPDVHVDGALAGSLIVGRALPERRDELGALDRAALAQHQVLQQLELLEREGGGL